jgi:hypothetical protein
MTKQYVFDHLAHLTFGSDIEENNRFTYCSVELAMKRMEWWANGLASLAQGPIWWMAFPELTHHGKYHLHALLGGTGSVDTVRMEARWRRRNGHFVKIDHYIEDAGIEEYFTKRISEDVSDVGLSNNFAKMAVRRTAISPSVAELAVRRTANDGEAEGM